MILGNRCEYGTNNPVHELSRALESRAALNEDPDDTSSFVDIFATSTTLPWDTPKDAKMEVSASASDDALRMLGLTGDQKIDPAVEWLSPEAVVRTVSSLVAADMPFDLALLSLRDLPVRKTLWTPQGVASVFVYDPSWSAPLRAPRGATTFKSGSSRPVECVSVCAPTGVGVSRVCLTQRQVTGAVAMEGRMWLFEQPALRQRIGIAQVKLKFDHIVASCQGDVNTVPHVIAAAPHELCGSQNGLTYATNATTLSQGAQQQVVIVEALVPSATPALVPQPSALVLDCPGSITEGEWLAHDRGLRLLVTCLLSLCPSPALQLPTEITLPVSGERVAIYTRVLNTDMTPSSSSSLSSSHLRRQSRRPVKFHSVTSSSPPLSDYYSDESADETMHNVNEDNDGNGYCSDDAASNWSHASSVVHSLHDTLRTRTSRKRRRVADTCDRVRQ